ncbi:MAG: SRPBCC family protein [Alphaproteobacteria bacterium]|nr:SRPBCC family protein [Alphaproteobacteria bacterium]
MLVKILVGIVAALAIFAIVVALQPSEFRISRSATITAPPNVVHAQVNDFRKWSGWSPWEKIDPALKRSYAGPAEGTGAVYAWTGNNEVGEGRMTILESRPGELVRIKLEFFKPFTATNLAEFTFRPQGSQTEVTWAMTGSKNFMVKAVHLFMNMDKMVGGMFEQGLTAMKSVSEAAAKS